MKASSCLLQSIYHLLLLFSVLQVLVSYFDAQNKTNIAVCLGNIQLHISETGLLHSSYTDSSLSSLSYPEEFLLENNNFNVTDIVSLNPEADNSTQSTSTEEEFFPTNETDIVTPINSENVTLTSLDDSSVISNAVTLTVIPTMNPTIKPIVKPTVIPTMNPTVKPTVIPTMNLTVKPTVKPTPKAPVRSSSRSSQRYKRPAIHFINKLDNYFYSNWKFVVGDTTTRVNITVPEGQYLLAICITANKLNVYTSNTMRLFHLYQQVFSFRGIVFTDTIAVEEFAKQQGLLVINKVVVNQYGMPFVRSMIARMVPTVPALYYGYCNSDILINPAIFNVLPLIQAKVDAGIVPGNFSIITRVINKPNRLISSCYDSISCIQIAFNRDMSVRRLRGPYCIDFFIWPSSFPFDQIPNVVVGRRYVDSAIIETPHEVNGCNIDISFAVASYHQDVDTYLNHGEKKQSKSDSNFNRNMVKNPYIGTHNADYLLWFDGRLKTPT